MTFRPSNLWEDLRRRRVFQVAAIYAASAWVIVQVADVFQEPLGIPDWLMTTLAAVVITGFPITVVLAWLFDSGPDGCVRTKPGSATGVLAIGLSLALLGAGTAGLYWIVDPAGDGERPPFVDEFEPDPFSLAVMPFTDFSPDNSLQHFAYGIAGVLIDQLSQIGELSVISDRSSRALPQDLGSREIGRQLNVARIVEGTVQRAGGRLRITAQLVDTRSGETLWTKRFDPAEADIFAVQDQIALAVADAINVVVEPAVRERLLRPLSDDEAAYELYLRGRARMNATEIRGDYSEAIDYFERALDLDPDLAMAWASLAVAVYWHGRSGFIDFEKAVARSWQASDRALEIDPKLGAAYAHRIWLIDDFDKRREAYERAVEYNPSWPYSYLSFGIVLVRYGKFDEAIRVLHSGLDLQPFQPDPLLRQYLGGAYIRTNDYDSGMRMLAANYLEHRGTNKEAQFLHWMAAEALGAYRYDEAAALLAIGHRDGLDNARARRLAASASLGMGRTAEAADHLARAGALLADESKGMQGFHPETVPIESARGRLALAKGDERAVVEQLRQATAFVARNPEGPIEDFWKYDICYWYLALRRYQEAAKCAADLVVRQDDVENLTMAAFAHAKIGEPELAEAYRERAEEAMEDALATSPKFQVNWVMAATFFAAQSDAEKALEMLEQAYALHYRDLLYLTQMPMFDSIRGDPRFSELLRRIRVDVAEMSRRFDDAAADGDFESLVERHLQPRVAVNFNY